MGMLPTRPLCTYDGVNKFTKQNRWKWSLCVLSKNRKAESLKKVIHGKIENVVGSVRLSLFMDCTGMCKITWKW
jgi:hypothetical protein